MSVLEMSLFGGMMILVTALVRLVAGDWLPRRGYVALWTAAVLRLLVPVKIASTVSFYGLVSRTGIKAGAPGAVAVEETPAGIPIWTVIWLVGMTVMGIAFAVSYIRCIRAFRTSTPLENKYIDDWITKNSHWRRVKIRTISGLRTPLTYGLLRPVILLPEDAEGWDAERLGMVLCHELVHIMRFDGALKKLSVLAVCVHWWNPAVWLMVALLDRDIELSCDGAVVERFGPERRAQYARLLIDLKAPRGGIPLVTGFGKNVTERRVRGVMGYKRATVTMTLISAILIMMVIATFATSARLDKSIGSPLENANDPKSATTVPDQSAEKSDAHIGSDSHALNINDIQPCEASQLSFDELADVLSHNNTKEIIFVPTHGEERVAYVISYIPAAIQGNIAQ